MNEFVLNKDIWFLQHIKEQNSKICELAVQENGTAIAYVKEQTPELCKLAIQQNGLAKKYIRIEF